MSHRHRVAALGKFLVYILGHHPDKFGLVLDEQGFVTIKELLQAINEEEGWSHVRRVDVVEVLMTNERQQVEINNDRIRVAGHPETPYRRVTPPKMLFYGARRKTYPHIIRKGLSPMGTRYLPLSLSQDLALRIAKRREQKPVMLEVHAERASRHGILFYQTTPLIVLTDGVPAEYITGPPLSSVLPEKPATRAQPTASLSTIGPGSVLLDVTMEPVHQRTRRTTWKEPSRKLRRR